MENFSTILQTVWRPAQKNSGGLHHPPPPPDRARVKEREIISAGHQGHAANDTTVHLSQNKVQLLNQS